MNRLGLVREHADVTITGVGGFKAITSKWKTYLRLHSQVNSNTIDVELYAVPKVTEKLNKLDSGDLRDWSHIAGLQLADPYFSEGGEIDILLGNDIVPYLLKPGLIKLNEQAPVAQETIFGWVLSGKVGQPQQQIVKINNFKCEISEAIKRFWELEELPFHPALTIEEEKCESYFISTHQRDESGRYTVRLPFNENKGKLGGSREQAFRRLRSLEKRFLLHPEFKQPYVDFMKEYELLGHMEKVEFATNKVSSSYYLPHHFVIKEDSTTTKQRTVFDGSAKTTSGFSLNDVLLVGATVQTDLYTILLCFRYDQVGLKADVRQMFRQFNVHPDDRNYQRILWREHGSQPVIEYRLTTVTYGTGCGPFLATRCLNQLAHDEKDRFPEAAKALKRSTYVDDYLGTAASTESAIKLVQQIIELIAAGGMEIRKWCTNDAAVLNSIPLHLREDCSIMEFADASTPNCIKALGIKWQPSTDEFMFTVNVNLSAITTKRFLLSEISKTFDPLGWLSPVTVNAKLLMQRAWLEGSSWDEPVAASLQESWLHYTSDLVKVESIRIPRCVIKSPPLQLELHGFSDSSELAYASAVYLKCVYQEETSVNLLTSRSRVAPLKAVSLPKLELCGAKLLADTIHTIKSTITHPFKLFCWTDSTITLKWIQSSSRKYKAFVANRVSEIQGMVPPQHWQHVRSEHNPADLPSRGISAEQLQHSNLWWHGPSWLQQETYPVSIPPRNDEEAKKEERTKTIACFHHAPLSAHSQLFFAFSSLSKLLRIVTYLIRFVSFISKQTYNKGPCTALELRVSKMRLIRWAQAASFSEEIAQLTKTNAVSSSSRLSILNPFIDANGVLRVGGRLANASLPEGVIHPIILLNTHKLTELIVRDVHQVHLHSGFTLTNAIIRKEYWILRGRDTIRHIIRKCVTCRRARAVTATQQMGNLPTGRVTPNRTFLHCGVDYAGPFQTKVRKGRHFNTEKSWFAIFVCFSTKAVHLEAVTSLSSEAFIACYERFVSRRGIPAKLYSDCGTNFVGADRILREYLLDQQRRLQDKVSSKGTTWYFNPPAAPHQGGLWESGVKSVKYHFQRVVGQRVLLLEEFQTLLCKIEACLNSRPLCALSSDPTDMEALTPGHFLIGEALTNIPEPDLTSVKENRLTMYESSRQLTQHFWKRWANEYLSNLQQRFKWTHKRDNLTIGDLVVIADEQRPVAKWKLGRVIATHVGSDGLVRSATVKTANGESRRPITKLAPLILNNEQ